MRDALGTAEDRIEREGHTGTADCRIGCEGHTGTAEVMRDTLGTAEGRGGPGEHTRESRGQGRA